MTDIVERLRESADGWFNEVGTRHEAADEIERLRAERDWLSKELEHMRVSYSSCDAALAQCEQNSQRIAAERDALRAALQEIAALPSLEEFPHTYQRVTEIVDAALAARGKDE